MRLVLALALAMASGCAVPAWQRERLAHPAMQDVLDPEREAFEAHVGGATESALEPSASGGGGCGCN